MFTIYLPIINLLIVNDIDTYSLQTWIRWHMQISKKYLQTKSTVDFFFDRWTAVEKKHVGRFKIFFRCSEPHRCAKTSFRVFRVSNR